MVPPPDRRSCTYCIHPVARHRAEAEALWHGIPCEFHASPGELSVLENGKFSCGSSGTGMPALLNLILLGNCVTTSVAPQAPSPFRSMHACVGVVPEGDTNTS